MSTSRSSESRAAALDSIRKSAHVNWVAAGLCSLWLGASYGVLVDIRCELRALRELTVSEINANAHDGELDLAIPMRDPVVPHPLSHVPGPAVFPLFCAPSSIDKSRITPYGVPHPLKESA
jgi:hypothetical protein